MASDILSVEGISQPWHSLAPRLGAKGQGSWISWQQVLYSVGTFMSNKASTRIEFEDFVVLL
jgi:hypothetical protein